MASEKTTELLPLTDMKVQSWPTAMEFELAYQARVAMDRIKFAIKHADQAGQCKDQMQEAGLQLLDALQRLETAERRFQERSRIGSDPRSTTAERSLNSIEVSYTNSIADTAVNGAYSRSPQAAKQKTRA